MRWLRQLLISIGFRRDAIYCVLINWTTQLFSLLLTRIIKKKRITPTNNSEFKTKNSKLSLISPPKCCIFALSYQSADGRRQTAEDSF